MIVIVDTGGANIASIGNALTRLGSEYIVSDSVDTINMASHVILPGVGAAEDSMKRLEGKNLVEVIKGLKVPTLGICLGMQILFDFSEEGDVECLGIIPGRVKKISKADGYPVPHMGWNNVRIEKKVNLLNGIRSDCHFYFVHSFAVSLSENSFASVTYNDKFSAVVAKDNFYGTQFHPERSSLQGAQILRNFLAL
jgi:glutamine amidotransferase